MNHKHNHSQDSRFPVASLLLNSQQDPSPKMLFHFFLLLLGGSVVAPALLLLVVGNLWKLCHVIESSTYLPSFACRGRMGRFVYWTKNLVWGVLFLYLLRLSVTFFDWACMCEWALSENHVLQWWWFVPSLSVCMSSRPSVYICVYMCLLTSCFTTYVCIWRGQVAFYSSVCCV